MKQQRETAVQEGLPINGTYITMVLEINPIAQSQILK